jgi:signal transduction histidine kinase
MPHEPGSVQNGGRRWQFTAAAFALGVLYTGAIAAAGVEVRLGGRDVSLPVGIATELAFGLFGFLLGRSAEARSSERRTAEAERGALERLAALQARLLQAEKLATVGQLSSRIAHEVRNPLAIVRSLVQNLREAAPEPAEDTRRNCALVLDEIDRLSRVTASLTGLARPVRPRLSTVSAAELVARVEWLARHLLEGRPIDLQAAPGPAAADVRADPDLVCQVLLGLIANGAEASPEGGSVQLEWQVTDGDVVFRVCDGGPGVASEIRERIFDPFFTTKETGTGLGLAVARELAEAQGGRVVLEGGGPSGACFALRLPRADRVAP